MRPGRLRQRAPDLPKPPKLRTWDVPLIDYVLAAERRGGEPLTMGDALAELLADITEAARTIGTLLQ